jgi:hypothetical protein
LQDPNSVTEIAIGRYALAEHRQTDVSVDRVIKPKRIGYRRRVVGACPST